jgi:hypothetical protein
MLSNEIFALACRAYYDEQGIVVDASNGQFAHCPQPERYGDGGYYLLWEHHQHQGLLQSRDIGECCFFLGHAKKWLVECDYWPDDYFELWDIYETYSGDNGRKFHEEKDETGKSVRAVQMGKKAHENRNSDGKSILGIKSAERLNAQKDENGRSLSGLKGAEKANARKDENGKSVNALMMNEKIHAIRNEHGKSTHALAVNAKIHEEKDELGRSKVAMKTANQVWESKLDGFRGNAGNVAQHNKANGWDPNARTRVA